MGPAGMAYPADLMTRTVLHIFVVLEEMLHMMCSDVVCAPARETRSHTLRLIYSMRSRPTLDSRVLVGVCVTVVCNGRVIDGAVTEPTR